MREHGGGPPPEEMGIATEAPKPYEIRKIGDGRYTARLPQAYMKGKNDAKFATGFSIKEFTTEEDAKKAVEEAKRVLEAS